MWPDESLSGSSPVRKYVLRMRNLLRPSGAFWPEVTKSRDRKIPCPEVCSAHAQPEVVPYLPLWGLLTGSDKVMWPEEALSGSGTDRRYVLRMPGCPRICSLVVVTWLPDVTKSHLTSSGFPWVSTCATPVVTEGHVTPLWKCSWGVLYDVRVL
jgi:hypothetical protein